MGPGLWYRPAVAEEGREEDPPIRRLTGYEVRPEDLREGRITPEGERRIVEHLRVKMARERAGAVRELYRRGVPYLLVDHGRMAVKLALYVSPQQPGGPDGGEVGRSAGGALSRAGAGEAVPFAVNVRVVNERNVEALGREASAIGEVEISFKVELR